MFIGREKELSYLNEFYQKPGVGMTVIYGRRRIGKSTLISEFVKDKKVIFYTATKVGKERNLELFSKQVTDVFLAGIQDISFCTIRLHGMVWFFAGWKDSISITWRDVSIVSACME